MRKTIDCLQPKHKYWTCHAMRPILWLIHFFNIDLPMENNQAETCAVKNTVVDVIDTQISPEGRLEVLSKAEVHKLLDNSHGGLHQIFRNCSLAVLNCGNYLDDGKELLERKTSIDISIIQRERGIKLDIKGAPAIAGGGGGGGGGGRGRGGAGRRGGRGV